MSRRRRIDLGLGSKKALLVLMMKKDDDRWLRNLGGRICTGRVVRGCVSPS